MIYTLNQVEKLNAFAAAADAALDAGVTVESLKLHVDARGNLHQPEDDGSVRACHEEFWGEEYPEEDEYGRRFRWTTNYSTMTHEREFAPDEDDDSLWTD